MAQNPDGSHPAAPEGGGGPVATSSQASLELTAERIERGARAIHKAVDSELGGWPWDSLTLAMKRIYGQAAVECMFAVRDA